MIGPYLIVAGVFTMVATYVATWHYVLSRTERRDFAALGEVPELKRPSVKTETMAVLSPDALPARA